MAEALQITPPAVAVSSAALHAVQAPAAQTPPAQTPPAAQPPPAATGATPPPTQKKPDIKSRIAEFAKEAIDDPNANPTVVSRQAVHPGEPDTTHPGAVPGSGPAAPASPASAQPGNEPPNYKVLKDALALRDAKVAELESEITRLKPEVELVSTLRSELEAKQKDYDEVREFREKNRTA